MSFSRPSRTTDYGWRPPTAYVDVLFLVITFFIVITTFRDTQRQIDVTLQESQSAHNSVGPATQTIITVRANGQVYLGEQPFTLDDLGPKLRELAAQFPDESVLIRGDRQSQLGAIIKIMDLSYTAGLHNVYLATVKPKSEI